MMSDAEIYEDYSRYAVTVAEVEPMRFETWAKKRDNPVPFRAWAGINPEDDEPDQQELHVEQEVVSPDNFETEGLQGHGLAVFQRIVSSPPSFTLSDELPLMDLNPDELDGQVLNTEGPPP
jgi:hypothetical protein